MTKKQLSTLMGALFALAIYAAGQAGWLDGLAETAQTAQPGQYKVVRYVDGDTISVDMNGTKETIRFIGIDTPETHKPGAPVQCYGPAAAAHTKTVIERAGGQVRLQADPLNTNRDRYNRLLRYVYLSDGTLVNELNVRQGYAFYYPYFKFSKSAAFEKAQTEAKTAGRGLWGNCTPVATDGGGYKME